MTFCSRLNFSNAKVMNPILNKISYFFYVIIQTVSAIAVDEFVTDKTAANAPMQFET